MLLTGLPLQVFLYRSFISSFFDMNAVDNRDMPSGQWLYWSFKVRDALTVLVSAYPYAYTGNASPYWSQSMLGRRRRLSEG